MGAPEGMADADDALPLTTTAMVLLFAPCLVLAAAWPRTAEAEESAELDAKRLFARRLFSEAGVLGLVLLYAYLCEHHPLNQHVEKGQSLPAFWVFTFLPIIAGFFTIGVTKRPGVLNRDQTEEWRGWLQVTFLLYHYFHTEEVYPMIRVAVSAYVWMTGFGNVMYFSSKHDFSFTRSIQMMWRINFFVAVLAWTMNNTYILYYICPLHSFHYFLSKGACFLGSQLHARASGKLQEQAYTVAIATIVAVVWLVWDCDFGLFDVVFALVPTWTSMGASYGVRYEWYFRTFLDHYSSIFGMAFAWLMPRYIKWLDEVPGSSLMLVSLGPIACLLVYLNWQWGRDKFEYNELHPFLAIVPISAYIYLRNLTPGLRAKYLGALTFLGRITLETYLLQHHVWMTSNAKSLLVVIPGFPLVNFLFVTTIYVALAWRTKEATDALRELLLPNDFKTTPYFVAALALAFVLAFGVTASGAGLVGTLLCVLATSVAGAFVAGRVCEMRLFNLRLVACVWVLPLLVGVGRPFLPDAARCVDLANEGEWVDRDCSPSFGFPHSSGAVPQACGETYEWSPLPVPCMLRPVEEGAGLPALTVVGDNDTGKRLFAALQRLGADAKFLTALTAAQIVEFVPQQATKVVIAGAVQTDAARGSADDYRHKLETFDSKGKQVLWFHAPGGNDEQLAPYRAGAEAALEGQVAAILDGRRVFASYPDRSTVPDTVYDALAHIAANQLRLVGPKPPKREPRETGQMASFGAGLAVVLVVWFMLGTGDSFLLVMALTGRKALGSAASADEEECVELKQAADGDAVGRPSFERVARSSPRGDGANTP